MMKIYKYLAMIVLIFALMLTAYRANSDPVTDYAYKSLRRAILSSINNKNEMEAKTLKYLTDYDEDGLILLLGEIENEKAQDVLLSLLDVYIGSSSSEALIHSITKQGKNIETKLKLMKEKPVGTMFGSELSVFKEEFIYLRFTSVKDRNRIIDRLLELIRQGIVVKYVL